jgi:hypothetical protein
LTGRDEVRQQHSAVGKIALDPAYELLGRGTGRDDHDTIAHLERRATHRQLGHRVTEGGKIRRAQEPGVPWRDGCHVGARLYVTCGG